MLHHGEQIPKAIVSSFDGKILLLRFLFEWKFFTEISKPSFIQKYCFLILD